jgi:hypothetical protein
MGNPTLDNLMLADGAASTAYCRAKGGLLPPAAQPLGAKASGPPVATRTDNADTLCADGTDNSAPASLAEISKFISGAGPYAMLSMAWPLVQLDVAGLHVVDLAAKDNAGIRRQVAPRGKPMSDKFLGEEIVDCCRRSMACVRHTIQVLNCMPNPVAVRTACKLIDLADSMLLHTALLTVDRLALTPTKANHLALSAAEEVARDTEERHTGLEDTISRLQELLEESETRATKAELLLAAQEAEIVGLKAMVKQAREAEKQALANTVCMLEAMKAQKAKPKSRKDSKKTAAETPQKSAETAPQPSATPALGLAKSWWAPGQVQELRDHVVLLDRDACKLLPDPFPVNTAARWASINKRFPDCAALPQEVQRAIDYTHTVELRTFKNCMDTNFMFKNISCIAGGINLTLKKQGKTRAELEELKCTVALLTCGRQVLPKKTKKPAMPAPVAPASAEFALAPKLAAPAPPAAPQLSQGAQQDWMESKETGPAVERHPNGRGGYYTVVPYNPGADPVFGNGPEGLPGKEFEYPLEPKAKCPPEIDMVDWAATGKYGPPLTEEQMAGGWNNTTDKATAPAAVVLAKKSAKAQGKEKEKPVARPKAKPAKAKLVTEAKAATGTGAGALVSAKKPSTTCAVFAGTAAMVAAKASAPDSWPQWQREAALLSPLKQRLNQSPECLCAPWCQTRRGARTRLPRQAHHVPQRRQSSSSAVVIHTLMP